MGAVLDTPATCPLCNESTRDPVVLKCSHRFCQRCIGDLWSVTPNGPFHCPEWRCKTVYQSLPFDSSLIRPPTPARPVQARGSAGTSNNVEQTSSDQRHKRPSLTSRLLGKRKASSQIPDEPVSKRSELACGPSGDRKQPAINTSQKPDDAAGVGTSQETCGGPRARSDQGDGLPENESVGPRDTLKKTAESVEESDTSSEIDVCDAPLVSPKQATHTPSKKPATASSSDCSGGPSGQGLSRVNQVGGASPVSPKKPKSASGSPINVAIFLRPENKPSTPVPCHYCPKARCQPAVNTCLVCGASMCQEHLRPHLESPVFQSHTLVSPVEDISLWKCQEHQEVNRIYCRQCEMCVCTVCTLIGSHRDHVCISIREAERELRANLKEEIKQLQDTEEQVKTRVSQLGEKKETSRIVLTEAQESVKQQYGAIREALDQEEQSALQCIFKEERRVLGGLEDKLSFLQKTLQSIQNGLHTLEGLADSKGDKGVKDQLFIMEYCKVSQMVSGVGSCVELFESPEEVNIDRLNSLKTWTEKRLDTVIINMPGKDRDLYRLQYGIIPVLDEDTAHPKLQLSDNNRKVSYSETQQVYADHESRFTSFPQVLASDALEKGRWYWEVNVPADDGRWKVGLCESQMERKGQKDSSRLGFNSHSWCLAYDKKRLEALHNKESIPVKTDDLQTIGVLLDFEDGSLSFFNATPGGSLVLLHSYKHSFSSPLHPAFSVSKTHLAMCDLFQ
ncbi:E3 ubiquitin/ISG15 ligase TRIM25 [Oryzias melastigma]|uniref:Si:dkey-29p10.4 n=1 Tax=Oryzias melastigma TaxID=30732 RepID=A0A3B3C4T2_ORYME|nr:E3 ubiquitin/ISG15 ligase TRIM25 [Oryzias melastigma]